MGREGTRFARRGVLAGAGLGQGRPSLALERRRVVRAGLLHPEREWKGKWITADLPRHDPLAEALAKSSWITAGAAANEAAAARHAFELPAGAVVRRATVDALADGRVTIHVNGQAFRQGFTSRTAPLHAEVGAQLKPGRNVVAIGAAAVRDAIRRDEGEAGRNAIVAHGVIELADGRRLEIDTDAAWKAAVAPEGDWFAGSFDDSGWRSATVLGAYAEQPSKYVETTMGPGRYLRKQFVAKARVVRARLYATALGVYEAKVNGRRVSDTRLDPGWTDYTKRVMVQTYDVTRLLKLGANTLDAVVADGVRGPAGLDGSRSVRCPPRLRRAARDHLCGRRHRGDRH